MTINGQCAASWLRRPFTSASLRTFCTLWTRRAVALWSCWSTRRTLPRAKCLICRRWSPGAPLTSSAVSGPSSTEYAFVVYDHPLQRLPWALEWTASRDDHPRWWTPSIAFVTSSRSVCSRCLSAQMYSSSAPRSTSNSSRLWLQYVLSSLRLAVSAPN